MSVSLGRTWAPASGLRVPATRRLLTLIVVAALIGALHLWLTIGLGVLLPSDPLWQVPQGDGSQAVLGAETFLRDPAWHFPLGTTREMLSDGAPVSIVYTDSAPWIAILVKLAGLGVGDVSVMGLVAVLSVALQPIAFALLLLALGVRRTESVLVGAAVGSMLPAWYMRAVWHVALSSHWVVVLALALAASAIRRGVSYWVIAGLAVLGALATGIHAYLFVMVAAIAAGALLADVARVGLRSMPRAAAGFVTFLVCSALSAWALGYRRIEGGGGFGLYSLNLLSPVMPQRSGIKALLTGDAGAFLDATGGQYEGFNYLGSGILLVLAVAAVTLLRRRGVRWAALRAVVPLGAALLALTLFALSNRVFIGTWPILDIKLSQSLDQWLGQVRSSGRMFWPVAYAGLAWSLLALDRVPHRRVAGAVLTAALLLQVADTSVVRRVLAEEYAPRPKPVAFDAATWRDGPLAGHDLRVLPSLPCAKVEGHEFIRQLALAVERDGGMIEGGPLARSDRAICGRERLAAAFPSDGGRRLDLMMRRSLPPLTLFLAARSGRCAAFGENLACGSAAVRAMRAGSLLPAEAPMLPALVPGQAVEFTSTGSGKEYLGSGWLAPEGFGTWTADERALLALPLPQGWVGDATFAVDAITYGASPLRTQEVTVLADGHAVAQWAVPMDRFEHFVVRVPSTALASGIAVLELVVPYPLLSNAAGHIKHRPHGFGLHTVMLLPDWPSHLVNPQTANSQNGGQTRCRILLQ